MERIRKSLAGVIALATLAILSCGCSTTPRVEKMAPTQLTLAKKHSKTVAVSAIGGEKSGASTAPRISNEAIAGALEDSILKSGLFSQVISSQNADYNLEVLLMRTVDPPAMAINSTTEITMDWKLTDVKTRKVVYHEFIPTTFTATIGNEFVGALRYRAALEGVVRVNIQRGLEKISKLDL